MKNPFMKVGSLLSGIDLFKFMHYNFFCKSIVREKGCYLMTYKNCVISLDKSAKIHLKSGNIQLGASKLGGSKAESYLRMGENASWILKGDAVLFYNTQIDVQKNGILA